MKCPAKHTKSVLQGFLDWIPAAMYRENEGMPEFIDARGLGCAHPVILARQSLETHNELTIVVDARIPVENITALALHAGYAMEVSEKPGSIYFIKLTKMSGRLEARK